jgi:hypothetical protein
LDFAVGDAGEIKFNHRLNQPAPLGENSKINNIKINK